MDLFILAKRHKISQMYQECQKIEGELIRSCIEIALLIYFRLFQGSDQNQALRDFIPVHVWITKHYSA